MTRGFRASTQLVDRKPRRKRLIRSSRNGVTILPPHASNGSKLSLNYVSRVARVNGVYLNGARFECFIGQNRVNNCGYIVAKDQRRNILYFFVTRYVLVKKISLQWVHCDKLESIR